MGKQNDFEEKSTKVFTFIIVIAGIIWLIFGLAVMIAPLVVIILFLVNLIRYLIYDRKKRSTNFWLSAQEQEQYEKSAYIIANAEEERKKVQDAVMAKGIYRNQDGQISQRSYVGKELRERENAANSLINQYTPIYNELRFKPYKRWKKARSHYSNIFGFGSIILVLALPIIIGISSPKDISESKPLISMFQSKKLDSTKIVEPTEKTKQMEQTEQQENPNDDSSGILSFFCISIGIMAGILGVMAAIWFIGWLIGRIKFGLKNPEPPLVSRDNVDTYIEKYAAKETRKETERQQRKEKLKQKREQKQITKKMARDEKIRLAEKKLKEAETLKVDTETISEPATEPEPSEPVPQENNTRQRSKEENLFICWADILRNDGYAITGNWENWENSGPWKNLAVISSVNGVGIRIIIEYYEKSRRIYFGIANWGEEKVSQELLNSETFQNIITENGLTVKNNGTWYCLKFSTFRKVFQEYRYLIETIK